MGLRNDRVDYHKFSVRKPWGYEYLMFENGRVALWYLSLKSGARTSMHCHPHKKTGLVLLSGEAVLSFLNGSTALRPISKMMIREGLFHSTAAVSPEGISLMEIETPCDKTDLVRLDDEYGRQEQPYEGAESLVPLTEDCLRLDPPTFGEPRKYAFCGCVLSMERIKEAAPLMGRSAGEIVVVLEGGLFSKTGEPVLGPGDAVSSDTLHRLAERFLCPQGASLLTIRRGA